MLTRTTGYQTLLGEVLDSGELEREGLKLYQSLLIQWLVQPEHLGSDKHG